MKKTEGQQNHKRWETYRQALLEKRADALRNLGFKFDALAAMGRVAEEDQAVISHDEFVSMRLNSLDLEQLEQVEEALDRMASGDYGTCMACEEQIPAKRLRAIPWARYCIRCQNRIVLPKHTPNRAPFLNLRYLC